MTLIHSPNIVRNGLILYMDALNSKCYSGSGSIINDISGNGYTGTLTNGAIVSNGYFSFDGVDDYISVSSPATLNPAANSFSIEAAVWQNSTSGYKGIVEARGSNLKGFLFILDYPTDSIAIFLNDIVSSSQITYTSSVAPFNTANIWDLVSVVVNRSDSTVKFYRNGSMIGVSRNITNPDSLYGTTFRYDIGNDLGGPEINGRIGFVRHYNRALTDQEIKQNFNATRGRYGI